MIAHRQFSSPWIIHNHHRAQLSSLHNCFYFAAILHTLPGPLCKQEVDRTFVVLISRHLLSRARKQAVPVANFGWEPGHAGIAS
jgi:hypothetical protein